MNWRPVVVTLAALALIFLLESVGSVGNATDAEHIVASINTLNAAVVVIGAFLIYGVFARRE